MGRIHQSLPLVTEITGHVVDNDPEDIGLTLVRSEYRAAQRKAQCNYRGGSYDSWEIFTYFHFDYTIAQIFLIFITLGFLSSGW